MIAVKIHLEVGAAIERAIKAFSAKMIEGYMRYGVIEAVLPEFDLLAVVSDPVTDQAEIRIKLKPSLAEARKEAIEFLDVSIEDGDPDLVEAWTRALGRKSFVLDPGNGEVLRDELPRLGNIAIVALIQHVYGAGHEELDRFVDAIDQAR